MGDSEFADWLRKFSHQPWDAFDQYANRNLTDYCQGCGVSERWCLAQCAQGVWWVCCGTCDHTGPPLPAF